MPSRTRTSKPKATPASTAPTVPTPNTDTINNTKENKKMGLTAEQIQALLADNRGRGDYGQYLTDFVAGGSPGEEVDMENGLLAGKTADKIKTGLENAKKARDRNGDLKLPNAQNVLIVKKGEVVFVINRDAAAGDAAE